MAKNLTVRLDDELASDTEALARAEGRSLNETIKHAHYLAIAAEITRLDTPTLIRVTKVDLAESALHAPAASFGETEFYPDFIDKAAVDDAERQCSPSPPAHGAKTMPALGCGATLHRHQLAHIRTKGRHLVD